jgi:hypothetical protein
MLILPCGNGYVQRLRQKAWGGMEKVLGVARHETCVLYSGYNPPTIFKISTNQNTLWALAAMLDFRSAPKTKIFVNRLPIGNSRWPP